LRGTGDDATEDDRPVVTMLDVSHSQRWIYP